MEYDVAFEFFMRTLLETRKCVVPLYRMAGIPPRPEFVGSSVYCRFGPVQMLLTAGHVLKSMVPDRPWYPHSDSEFRQLPCDEHHYPKRELEDSAVAPLTEGLSPMWTPLSSARFTAFSGEDGFQHFLVGYPSASTKGSTPQFQRIEIKGYLTAAAPPEEYSRLSADPRRELVVVFRKKNVYERDRKKSTFPNPNGMSGGAVFQFHESDAKTQSLVGLMTRWDVTRKRAIIAERIESVTGNFRVLRITR